MPGELQWETGRPGGGSRPGGDTLELIHALQTRLDDVERTLREGGVTAVHPDLTVHDAMGLATQDELDAIVASGTPDATATLKGKLKLAWDLGGTADLPTVPGLALKADAAATTSALATKLPLAGGVMTGAIVLAANAAAALQAVPRQQLDLGLALKQDIIPAGTYVPSAGGTMTGALVLSADAIAALQAVPKQQLDSGLATKADAAATTTALNARLPLAGGVMSGAIVLPGDAAAALQAVPKQQLDAAVAAATIPDATATVKGKLQLAGDLAGPAAAPTVPGLATKLALAGGTLTGALTLAADPAAALQAATRQYVDAGVASATIPDATTTVKGKLQLAGDLAGTATLPTVPGLAAKADAAATTAALNAKLALAGGTMTGAIVLSADAAAALQAVPKQQLDSGLATKADAAATTTALNARLPLAGGTVTGPLILAMSVVTDVPLTARGAINHTADLVKIQDPAAADLLRVTAGGRQLIGSSTMLGVTAGVVDAMLVVNQPTPPLPNQIWRGSPRGDGFAYTAMITDGGHFTTNGAITSNGASDILLPQQVRQSQPVQYMFAAGCDLSFGLDNACYVSDTINSINHFNGFVKGGGLHPYFQIAYDGQLLWGDGAMSSNFSSLRRDANGGFVIATNGTDKVAVKYTGELGVGALFPTNKLTVDSAGNQIRIRSDPNRYRGDFDMTSTGMIFQAYDDTGAAFMPMIVQASQMQWRIGFTEKMRLSIDGDLGLGTNDPLASFHVYSRNIFRPAIIARASAGQSDPIQKWESSSAAALLSVTGAGVLTSTVPGPLIPSPGASSTAIRETIRLPYTSAVTSTNKTGQVVNVIGVTLLPDSSMPFANGWVAIGDTNLDYVHFLSKIDCAGQPVIDSNFFGNAEGLYSPRLSQALDSTVPQYNTLTVGISTMPSGGVGYLAAIDRLVFNSGQTIANSKATFKNLGAVELLSDTMALKFGDLGDVSLSYFGGGIKVAASGGLLANTFQDTTTGGTYFEFAAGKLLVQPRGATPGFEVSTTSLFNQTVTVAAPSATAVPFTILSDPATTTDQFRIVGPPRSGNPADGKYRVIVDRNMGIATNAAISVSTAVWTGAGQTVPPVLAQGRPYCIGSDSDVVGPTLWLKGNGAGTHVEVQDHVENVVMEAIGPPGSGGLGAWLSIGAEDPIATLTLDDKYEEPAGGAPVSFVMRHGRGTGAPASVRFKLPFTGDLDISANSEAAENALSEWALRYGHNTQGISFQTASTPGGARTEMGRFVSTGLLLKAPTATAGSPDRTSPTLSFQDTYWDGAASVTRGYRVKDVALGSGPHALQFVVDETSLVALALGYTGQVGVGDPFVTNPGGTGQLHVVAAAAGNPALVTDTAASPTADIQKWRAGSTEFFAIDPAGLPKWTAAGNQQTTVGAAGGASAPPATPTTYVKIKNSAGTTLVLAAYAAA